MGNLDIVPCQKLHNSVKEYLLAFDGGILHHRLQVFLEDPSGDKPHFVLEEHIR